MPRRKRVISIGLRPLVWPLTKLVHATLPRRTADGAAALNAVEKSRNDLCARSAVNFVARRVGSQQAGSATRINTTPIIP